jgi:hypothetical protein
MHEEDIKTERLAHDVPRSYEQAAESQQYSTGPDMKYSAEQLVVGMSQPYPIASLISGSQWQGNGYFLLFLDVLYFLSRLLR